MYSYVQCMLHRKRYTCAEGERGRGGGGGGGNVGTWSRMTCKCAVYTSCISIYI
jgi:hypothetical protein